MSYDNSWLRFSAMLQTRKTGVEQGWMSTEYPFSTHGVVTGWLQSECKAGLTVLFDVLCSIISVPTTQTQEHSWPVFVRR